ncbi:MAG: hypothetical protein WCE25_01255 [Nitrososphaeraceae archaeon]
MSNIEASEENVKSPSTYGNDAYQEFRKKEKIGVYIITQSNALQRHPF